MPASDRPSFRFRPTLEALEDRLSPGSLSNVFGLSHRPGGDDDLFGAASAHSAQAAGPSRGNPNAGVLPIDSSAFGKTYSQWAGQFWVWLFSHPADAHPLFDTAPVSANQNGQVWFLGGTFAAVDQGDGTILGQVTRDVTIPSGTALFLPLVNAEASDLEGNGTTEAELRASADALGDAIDPGSLFVQVDGRSLRNLDAFRAQSPLMTTGPLPENNIFGAPAGSAAKFVADGYHVILSPLSVGTHTLHFGGQAVIDTPDGTITFVQDVTYNITVTPGRR